MSKGRLFIIQQPKKNPKLRLFCFPYAGGSASIYHEWGGFFEENIEVVAIQPPGRTSRINEPPHQTMAALVAEIITQAAYITSTLYVFFGHSLGGQVAFELTRQLTLHGFKLPEHIITSGSRVPHIPSKNEKTYNLPHDEFIASLKVLKGTPTQLLENDELMSFLLPLIRADFKIAESYQIPKTEVSCPITVFSGTKDSGITAQQLMQWRDLTSKIFEMKKVDGEHLFIHSHKEEVIVLINTIISMYLTSDLLSV